MKDADLGTLMTSLHSGTRSERQSDHRRHEYLLLTFPSLGTFLDRIPLTFTNDRNRRVVSSHLSWHLALTVIYILTL